MNHEFNKHELRVMPNMWLFNSMGITELSASINGEKLNNLNPLSANLKLQIADELLECVWLFCGVGT